MNIPNTQIAVLDTLVESAARLCRADRAAMRIARDGVYHHLANYGFSPEASAAMKRDVVIPSEKILLVAPLFKESPFIFWTRKTTLRVKPRIEAIIRLAPWDPRALSVSENARRCSATRRPQPMPR